MHQVGDVIEQDGVQVRVTEVDDEGNVVATEPIAAAPNEPTPPDPAAEAARLREENARLLGENRALRETRRDPEPKPAATADPFEAEYKAIEDAFAKGDISDGQRAVRLGALGARAASAADKARERAEGEKARLEKAKLLAGQKVAAYIARYSGLQQPNGAEMQRVHPHLRAVCEETGWEAEDERAQVLALERTFGPIDRSLPMNHREWERRRHPVGGGGGSSDEPTATPKAESKGERIFNKLAKEHQDFYIQTRGSKEAAIKTLEFADETLMRRQGRFVA